MRPDGQGKTQAVPGIYHKTVYVGYFIAKTVGGNAADEGIFAERTVRGKLYGAEIVSGGLPLADCKAVLWRWKQVGNNL